MSSPAERLAAVLLVLRPNETMAFFKDAPAVQVGDDESRDQMFWANSKDSLARVVGMLSEEQRDLLDDFLDLNEDGNQTYGSKGCAWVITAPPEVWLAALCAAVLDESTSPKE